MISLRTKANIIIAIFIASLLVATSVYAVTRTISDSNDNLETFIRCSNGNYYSVTGANIQTAVDCFTDGGTVWLPNSVIEITTGITIPKKVTLTGGSGTVIKAEAAANLNYLINFPLDVSLHSVISHITLDGNKDNGNSNVTGILVKAGTPDKEIMWIEIINNRIINCSIGIELLGYSSNIWERIWHIKILHNSFGGSGASNNKHINATYAYSILVKDNAFEDADDIGIHLYDCRGWQINGNWFDDITNFSIYMNSSLGEWEFNTIISNNVLTDAGNVYDGIYLGHGVSKVTVESNSIKGCGRDGIRIYDRYNIINGNHIISNTGNGINCTADAKFLEITNNEIISNTDGINSSVASTYDIITGNMIYANSRKGLYFSGSNSVITNNNFFTNTDGVSITNTNGLIGFNSGYETIFPTINVTTFQAGYAWFDTVTNNLNIYNGTAWVNLTFA